MLKKERVYKMFSKQIKRELKHFESGDFITVEKLHFEDKFYIKIQTYNQTIKQICLNESEFKKIINAFNELKKEA